MALRLVLFSLVLTSASLFADERDDIHATAEDAQPILPGMKAPAFSAQDIDGQPVNFDPDGLSHPLVLTFYRGGWCPYCNLHLAEMRAAETELLEMGFDVWFISIDQPSVLAAGEKYGEVSYTLLSDSDLEATRAFGIAYTLDEETRLRYLRNDMDIEAASGRTHHVLPVPSTFIIGKDGIVSFQYSNVDYHVRLAPELLVSAARAHGKNYDQRLRIRRAEQRAAEQKSGN
ncbi:MAG: AhpC/TSA family protein [Gammaproteobacteria bacterium]|nr:AhpC/TSA family protein [Gammaproteobacteria bacterium]